MTTAELERRVGFNKEVDTLSERTTPAFHLDKALGLGLMSAFEDRYE
jgi:hypothetical protein